MGSWLIWNNEDRLWWKADERGYTRFVADAGRYTLERARSICALGPPTFTDDQPNPVPRLCIQPSPELIERIRRTPDALPCPPCMECGGPTDLYGAFHLVEWNCRDTDCGSFTMKSIPNRRDEQPGAEVGGTDV